MVALLRLRGMVLFRQLLRDKTFDKPHSYTYNAVMRAEVAELADALL